MEGVSKQNLGRQGREQGSKISHLSHAELLSERGEGRSQFPQTPEAAEAPGVCAGAVVIQPQGLAANDRAS